MTHAGGEREGTPPDPLRIEPAPGAWTLAEQPATGPLAELRRTLREELGLPADRPIIMTGHQCDWWHAGVVSKYAAMTRAADTLGAHAARLWVDQDTNDPTQLRYPASDGSGGITERSWEFAPETPVAPETPTGARDPIDPAPPPTDLHDAARAGSLDAIRDAMLGARREPTLARQVARAVRTLAPAWTGDDRGSDVFTLDLARTDAFGALVVRMANDPPACTRAYNDAAGAHPDAGIRPLTLRGSRIELPLWRVRPGEPRLPVYAGQLDAIPRGQLAPRALLMTGLLRLCACDLFIHGTGGAGYAPVTAQWFEEWLGEWLGARTERLDGRAGAAGLLAPVVMVTATVTLADAGEDLPTPESAAEARALAHKARHDPSLIGDAEAARAKAELLGQIDAAKQRGEKPGSLFAQMQRLLGEHRERNARALESLDAEADRLESASKSSALLLDRTWAFPLLPENRLALVERALDRAFERASVGAKP